MNKRITYLLATLLATGSFSTVYATETDASAVQLHQTKAVATTTGSGITTGPALQIKPSAEVIVSAYSNTTGSSLRLKDFDEDFVGIKVTLDGTAFKDPRNSAASIAYAIDSSINLKLAPGAEQWELTYSTAIYNDTEFSFYINTSKIDKSSISDDIIFTIPKALLTTDHDITVKIPVLRDSLTKPQISLQSGIYSYGQTVTLSCATEGAEIRYTLDGSEVTASSPLYTGKHIVLTQSSTLKAAAFKDGKMSETVSANYIISTPALTPDVTAQVSSHSMTNTSGLYRSAFDQDSVVVLVSFTDTSFKDPKYSATSVASSLESSLNLKAKNADEAYKMISSVYINSATEFMFTINTSELDKSSIKDALTFTIPKSLLVTEQDVTVYIPLKSKPSSGGGGGGGSSTVAPEKTETTEKTEGAPEEVTQLPNDTASITLENVKISEATQLLLQKESRNLGTKTCSVNYGLVINNKQVALTHKLLNSNGRTLVPIRTLSEALNLPIHYDNATKTAFIQKDGKTIELPLGYNVAVVNGEVMPLDPNNANVFSTIAENRAYLPLQFIAKQLNLNVSFNGKNVNLTTK